MCVHFVLVLQNESIDVNISIRFDTYTIRIEANEKNRKNPILSFIHLRIVGSKITRKEHRLDICWITLLNAPQPCSIRKPSANDIKKFIRFESRTFAYLFSSSSSFARFVLCEFKRLSIVLRENTRATCIYAKNQHIKMRKRISAEKKLKR